MKQGIVSILGLSVALSILSIPTAGQGDDKAEQTPAASPDKLPAEATIIGVWTAKSVSITSADGKQKTLHSEERPFNLTVTDKQLTMRVGDKVLGDMAYALDAKPDPWTIDLKSPAGVMLGICRQKGEDLDISLNDETKGRPTDFDKKNGMVMTLKRFHVRSLFTINADGSDLRRVLTLPDYTNVGSPDWSHDGGRIAFDAWRSLYGEGFGQVQILMVNADGTGFKHLGEGAMPSWSPDDKQLTFCSNQTVGGVWIMDADGSNRRCIAPDGWGSQWSPTRNEIAFSERAGGTNLVIFDVATSKRRALLNKAYQQIYWGISWSPDGKWISFKGVLPDGKEELAAVSTEGEEKGFKVILPDAMPDVAGYNNTNAWGGDGNQILVSLAKKDMKQERLYLFDFTGTQPPRLFPGYPEDWGGVDMAWSTDYKKVTFTATPPVAQATEK